jgi:hypothetical protein
MGNRSHGETRLIEAPSGAAHHSWPRLRSVAAQIGVGADLRQPPQLETDTTSEQLTRWLILFFSSATRNAQGWDTTVSDPLQRLRLGVSGAWLGVAASGSTAARDVMCC